MPKAFVLRLLGILLALCLSPACSKKKPPEIFLAVPEEMAFVMVCDYQALESVSERSREIIPPEMHAAFGSDIGGMREKAAKAGVDVEEVKTLYVIGWVGGVPPDFIAVFSGVKAAQIKGEKVSVHHGVGIYESEEEIVPGMSFYADLKPLGVAFGFNKKSLGKSLDAYQGRRKRITDSDAWDSIEQLLGLQTNYSHMRVYIFMSKALSSADPPFGLKAAGFFVHFQQGVNFTVMCDEEGANTVKHYISLGLMAAQTQGFELPPELERARPIITEVLGNTKVVRKDDVVLVDYRGNFEEALVSFVTAFAPSSLDLVREKQKEVVHENLASCYRSVIEYSSKPLDMQDGKKSRSFPSRFRATRCPHGLTKDTLAGSFHPSEYAGPFKSKYKPIVLEEITLEVPSRPPACYLATFDAPGKQIRDGQSFYCRAWTDFDNDGKLAHWYLKGTYKKESDSFKTDGVVQDEKADDW
jgi:hypothetical protein